MIERDGIMYADYDFYANLYRGMCPHDYEFDRLACEASVYIDAATFDRLHNGWPITSAVRYACCAIVDAIYQYGTYLKTSPIAVKSENIDGYSVTYADVSALRKDAETAKLEALDRYLPPTDPLRYAGGDR